MNIHPSGTRIEGIRLGAGEEIYEDAGRASDTNLNGIGKVGDRATEGPAAWGVWEMI